MFQRWGWLLALLLMLPLAGWVGREEEGRAPTLPPEGLVMVGQLTGDVTAVAVEGERAAIGLGRAVRALDITHPANPALLGQPLGFPGVVSALAFATTAPGQAQRPPAFLYVVADATLFVVDFSNPALPALVGSCALAGAGKDMAVTAVPAETGGWLISAYVAAGEAGLRIIEVSDPAQPREVGYYDTPWFTWRVATDLTSRPGEIYAHVIDKLGSLRIVRVTDAAHPVLVATHAGVYGDVAVTEGYAYVSGDGGITILDLSDITQPRQVSSSSAGGWVYFIPRLAIAQNRAFVVGESGNMAMADVTDPRRPFFYVERFWTRTAPAEVIALPTLPGQENALVYVASGRHGLQIISWADVTHPERIGWLDPPGNTHAVTIAATADSTLAYVSDRDGDLHIVDVNQSENPHQLGSYDSTGMTWSVALAGDVAYVAAGEQGLHMVDMHDRARPQKLGSFSPFDSFIRDVVVMGHYAYASDHRHGRLFVLDVADPERPRLAKIFDSPGGAYAVAAVENLIYLADGMGGLRIVDVSKPDSPAEVGSWQSPGVATDVVVSGTLAYVAGHNKGLHIVDVSNPAQPQLVATFDTPGLVWGVAVEGAWVYLADGPAGVRLLDVSDPAQPREAAAYVTPGYAWNVAVAGGQVYVAAESGGLVILRHAMLQPQYLPLVR